MASMSYCRFRNVRSDLAECLDALEEGDTLSEEEAGSGVRMFRQFLNFCMDNDIIGEFDGDALTQLFHDRMED